MFGIGLPELAVIAFFGVVLLGPDKLPDLARQLAHGIKTVKRMGDSVRDDLRSSLGDDYADLELRDLHPRELIRRQVEEALAEREDENDDNPATPAPPDERKTA
jgi:sec-independent protein translocase protein TatB